MKTKLNIALVFLVFGLAIGVPLFLHFRKTAQEKVCFNNLMQINEPQVCCLPLATRLYFGDTMKPNDLFQYVKGGACPVCPAGGEYIISWIVGGPYPKCSIHGDLLQEAFGDRQFKVGMRPGNDAAESGEAKR